MQSRSTGDLHQPLRRGLGATGRSLVGPSASAASLLNVPGASASRPCSGGGRSAKSFDDDDEDDDDDFIRRSRASMKRKSPTFTKDKDLVGSFDRCDRPPSGGSMSRNPAGCFERCERPPSGGSMARQPMSRNPSSPGALSVMNLPTIQPLSRPGSRAGAGSRRSPAGMGPSLLPSLAGKGHGMGPSLLPNSLPGMGHSRSAASFLPTPTKSIQRIAEDAGALQLDLDSEFERRRTKNRADARARASACYEDLISFLEMNKLSGAYALIFAAHGIETLEQLLTLDEDGLETVIAGLRACDMDAVDEIMLLDALRGSRIVPMGLMDTALDALESLR